MNMTGHSGLIDSPRRWDFLANLMIEQNYKTFVEIGCKEGRTTGFILKNVPDSTVIAVDPWITQDATHDPTKETYKEWDFSKIEAQFWDNVGADRDRCEMWRMTSEEAAKIHGEGADIVFIDALHDYEHVKQDIELWWPKVRSGGILSGHDANHRWPGVERAIADSFDLMSVGIGPDSVWFVVKVHEDQFRGNK